MATETAGNTNAGTSNIRQRRGSEALQLHSSDHPGMILVSTPLDGKNFLAWSRGVRRALEAKSKLGFIISTCKRPVGDPELIEQWTRTDSMVVTWLLNAMNKSIPNAFIYTKSARVLWITLIERYGVCNGPLLYQLEREISSATQGDLSIMNYFTKLQMLWDELVELRPLPECTCASPCTCNMPKATTELIEERHLMQFLIGLNDEYDGVRSQILVSEPLPSINKAYRMILQVERQHQDRTTKEMVAVVRQYKNLYILNTQSFDPSYIKSFFLETNFVSNTLDSDVMLWHKRMGHHSSKVLEHAPFLETDGIKKKSAMYVQFLSNTGCHFHIVLLALPNLLNSFTLIYGDPITNLP
ncbi:UNVERIFIED_CONTAM: hypothetical protein Slati_2436400 [Sesamum latifolium]|uniref:Retrotransposon Copia-like N-terminal domain-containing protein n=1 Tax=Sesamum latifolium TaxID=2727402 RepID=A0AAW2WCU4_9LAMI